VQPQLEPEADDSALDLLPLDGAANTDSCSVCFALWHFGQVIAWALLSTIRSYRSPQSLQTYS
jgi:hypothetical protein